MEGIVKELEKPPAFLLDEETAEIRAFLAWAADNHFTFLGYRDYNLETVNGEDQLRHRRALRAGRAARTHAGWIVREASRNCLRSFVRWRAIPSSSCSPRRTRAPPCIAPVSRLHRCEALRCIGQGHRRASLCGSLYVVGVSRGAARCAAASPQGRQGDRARGLSPRQPHVQEPSSRCCRSIRATSSSRSTRRRCSRRRWASCAWATGARPASSFAVISSAASTRASSSCRARASIPMRA